MQYLVVVEQHWKEPLILVTLSWVLFKYGIKAVILVYVGDLIGINLYYVALIGFGLRVFINVGAIRKIIMTKRF